MKGHTFYTKAIDVWCSTCGARPGVACTGVDDVFHWARIQAAGDVTRAANRSARERGVS